MSPRAQNMKTGSNALDTAENESGSAKHKKETRRPRYRQKRLRARLTWKKDPTPSIQPKMSPGSQNMKTGPDALGTAKNESGGQNIKTGLNALGTAENESGEQNMKTGPNALGSSKNENGRAKHEIVTRRTRHCRK
jgi:hypothetical protein